MTFASSPSTSAKLLLIDDDESFGSILSVTAKSKGLEPHYYTSLLDLGSFALIEKFDIALIDYYLESLNGDEIAEYVDTFFAETPVIIVSAREFSEAEKARWPACVRHFVSKSLGAAQIVDEVITVLERDRLLKHYYANSSNQTIRGLSS